MNASCASGFRREHACRSLCFQHPLAKEGRGAILPPFSSADSGRPGLFCPPPFRAGAISPALPSTPQKGNSNLLLDSAKKCWRRVGARESEGKGGFKNPPSSRLPPPVSDWHPEAFLPRRLSAGARAQGSLTLKTIALPAPRANQGRPSPLKSSSGEKNPAA